MDISLTSIPVFSQRFAISLINEIFVAKNAFEAYFINSAALREVLKYLLLFFYNWQIK